MPLAVATPFPTSGKRTVSYVDANGKTKNATLTDTSAWKANTGVDYTAVTDVVLTIDGTEIVTVDVGTGEPTNLADVISELNADEDFDEAATASASGGRLLVTVDAGGEHTVVIGGIAGQQVAELNLGHQTIAEVEPATSMSDTEVYRHRVGPA